MNQFKWNLNKKNNHLIQKNFHKIIQNNKSKIYVFYKIRHKTSKSMNHMNIQMKKNNKIKMIIIIKFNNRMMNKYLLYKQGTKYQMINKITKTFLIKVV